MTITSSSTLSATAAAGKASAAAVDKKSPAGEDSAVPFEQLLQGLARLVAEQSGDGGQDLASGADADAALLAPGAVLGLEHMHSLVGQTLRLDTQADRAQRDGSFAAHAAALSSAMPAAGRSAGDVPIVALGVQPQGRDAAAPPPAAQAIAADAQLTQLEQAADDAQAMGGAAVQQEAASDAEAGRVVLQTGVWQLVSPAAAAPVAALAGQIGQWAAQWLGTKGAGPAQEQADQGRHDGTVPGGLAVGASPHRLTEQAVQAATASEHAQNDAEPQQQEDLRFWLKGDQQRGEVLLQRDGQPVRVQVHMRGNEAHVVFRSDQADLRQLLDAGLNQLGDLLAQQGLALADAQVQPDARQGQGQEAPAWGQSRQGRVVVEEVPAAQAPAQSLPSNGRLNVYA
ncbi:flagellar hook-length control protein FliK [Comamonas nitrativorans]|uniref:Flagellar hook-length control protein FliK n=1 Tax=Comamonas nitrativorans TaxID=108437 RepID=A0ABV9GUM6_9BURK